MHHPFKSLIPIRDVLNDPASPFFDLRWRDARKVIGPIVKRKSAYAKTRKEYFHATDVEQARKRFQGESDT